MTLYDRILELEAETARLRRMTTAAFLVCIMASLFSGVALATSCGEPCSAEVQR